MLNNNEFFLLSSNFTRIICVNRSLIFWIYGFLPYVKLFTKEFTNSLNSPSFLHLSRYLMQNKLRDDEYVVRCNFHKSNNLSSLIYVLSKIVPIMVATILPNTDKRNFLVLPPSLIFLSRVDSMIFHFSNLSRCLLNNPLVILLFSLVLYNSLYNKNNIFLKPLYLSL